MTNVSNLEGNIGKVFSSIGFWGKYLGPRRTWYGRGYLMKSFMIFFPHQMLWKRSYPNYEMGGVYGTYRIRRFSAARLLRFWVWIQPGPWMFVCCECCVLSGRRLCDGFITRPEESCRLWRVVVCDQETPQTRRLKPATGLWKYNHTGL